MHYKRSWKRQLPQEEKNLKELIKEIYNITLYSVHNTQYNGRFGQDVKNINW